MKDRTIKAADINAAFQTALEFDAASHVEKDRQLSFEYKKKFEGMMLAFKKLGIQQSYMKYVECRRVK